ncbi:MAG TPA: hypothetical protein VK327_00205, partial [Candidatus Paceibacterota bacterium]|nr:hypothetical protein [Candidatus Paceibacterota bacterium]
MTLPQFCLSYIESRLVWAGFKPPLPPRNGRFSLARVLVMTFGQTVVGAAIGWAVAALLGFLFHRTGPFVLFNGPFSWLVWLLAALSACQGIISYGFTALCWNQRAAQLLTDPTLDVKLKPTRYPVFRWLLGLVYFVIFALIAPVALLWTVENVRGEMLWRMERNKLIALGERLTFRDILGPTIPPEQNAAAAPIFAPFFNYKIEPYKIEPTQTETFHAVWLDTNGLQRFDDRLTIPGKIWPQREKSAAGEPHTPAGNLSAWAESYRHYLANPPKDAPSWTATLKLPSDTNNPARVVLAGLSVGDQELAEICDATLRPRSQFPIHYDENFSALLRHLAPFKSV